MSENIKINVNGNQIESAPNKLLIEACEDSGIHIPRFCWHKRLDPVGMCRMCLVEIETPRGKMLVPSCTTEVTDEMVVDTESEVVKKAQEGVLEFLLINHPLDCPICDKAVSVLYKIRLWLMDLGKADLSKKKDTLKNQFLFLKLFF